jgi:phosphate acyltransferase
VMLDLGANVECDAANLVQFAVMGNAFARIVLGLPQPVIGLLNVGSEDMKGNDAVRGAHVRLREGITPIRFHGFVEGDDIAAGTVDVFVTDGFTGNVALKAIEGVAKLFTESLRASFHHSVPARIGYVFARGSLKKLGTRLDPRRYNGAMFLGLAGIAVKSHGSTDAFGFANAIGVAADVKRYGLLEKIIDEMARLNAAPAGSGSSIVAASI